MEVSLEVIKYFRLVRIETFEDLETIKEIILNDLSDEEFLVAFYLGLNTGWGVNLDKRGELTYCEKPKRYLSSWVAWYLGYSKERVRQLIANIECKVYNAFYKTNFTYTDFLKYIAERKKIEREVLKEKLPQRYEELKSQGEKFIIKKLAEEFHISKNTVYSILNSLTLDKKLVKI